MKKNIRQRYDEIIRSELRKRLKREPTPNELANSDTDSDLVNETMWQLIEDLSERVERLERKQEEHGII